MNAVDTNAVLNRLSVIHNRSIPTYLSYAGPWIARRAGNASDTLSAIAADHRRTVDRLGEMIMESGGDVDPGEFPMLYTAWHDVSFDFVLDKMIDKQRQDITAIEECVEQLTLAPLAKSVAEEALGAAKGHLESLEELKTPDDS